MAIENVVVNFGWVTADETGKTINNLLGGRVAGVQDADLDGYDTGAGTGIALILGSDRTADGSGRIAGADTLIQQINDDVAYHTGSGPITDTFILPGTVTSCTVIVHLCTTYSGQGDIDVWVNGATISGFDSTNNTDGAVLIFTSVTPNAEDEIDITLLNNAGSYLAINGYQILDIVEGGGAGSVGNGALLSEHRNRLVIA